MKIIPATIADPAFCAELERLAAEVERGAVGPYPLQDALVDAEYAVQAVFPLADDLGIVATDALYAALGALSFVADLAGKAGL